jgi:signal transduction histidine kinase
LLAALAVPLIGLVAITVFEVAQSADEAQDIRNQANLAKSATGPDGLLTSLQDERNRATIDLIGQGSLLQLPVETNAEARQVVDSAFRNFENLIGQQQREVQETYAPAFEKLAELEQIRSDIDANEGPYDLANIEFTDDIFRRYSELIDVLLQANTRVAVAIDDPDLRRGADLSSMASRETDLIARLVRTLLFAGATNDQKLSSRDELARAGGLYGQVDKNNRAILDMATGDYQEIGDKLRAEITAGGFIEHVVPEAIETGTVKIQETLDAVSVERDESYYGFRSSVKQILERKADDLAAEADQRVRLFRIFAVLAVIVAAAATWAVSRSITRPLRALTRQATDMANHHLPDAVLDILDTPLGDDVTVPHVEPVQVQTRDEVADVAMALNTVQDSALELAVEQAVLRRNIADSFVNLGRRNQNLLGRQLDFITELEHNETDPDTLANLFRLDHLATRMRRNAESLLVLAGIDPPRKWTAPVRITDAIRAALGEVEDYQRVTVRAVEPATILGSAAADLAHLLAELIENALIFSPPDQTVEIRGRSQPAGYTLAVIDSGLGMPPEELARANRRLAGAESFTIAPSKYLGHYVAGNLAARHGINVTLHNSPGHGITATINLPPSLLTTEPAAVGAGGAPADTAPGAPELQSTFTPRASTSPAARQQAAAAAGIEEAGPLAHTASGLAKRAPRGGAAPQPPAVDVPAADAGPDAGPGAVPGGPGRLPSRIPGATGNGIPGRGPGGQPGTTQPALPDDDLIRTLAQYTTRREGLPPATTTGPQPVVPTSGPYPAMPGTPGAPGAPGVPGAPAPGMPGGEAPFAPAAHTGGPNGGPMSPATGTPALSHLPPFPSTPPAGVQMRGGPSGPALRPRPTPPPTPGSHGRPGMPGTPSLPETVENPALTTGPRPIVPSRPPLQQRGPMATPAGAGAGAGGDPTGATASGLTRRVRGAQLPNTAPVSLRRGTGGGAGGPGGRPHSQPAGAGVGGPFGRSTGPVPRVRTTGSTPAVRTGSTPAVRTTGSTPAIRPGAVDQPDGWASQNAAKDVYSFLTDFTAGVQRGLDESDEGPQQPG